jgi:spore maturation protein CgeB
MKMVVFGLTVSSSWGNGHATLWRGLIRALTERGWRIVFFEHDVAYYAETRDLHEIRGGELILYQDWQEILAVARRHLADADVAVVTSFCPDGIAATELLAARSGLLKIFYDLDTPVTLAALSNGEASRTIGSRGLREFDLVLSYTGGAALAALKERLGARRVMPLYGHVDPTVHRPSAAAERFRSDLAYIGTYAQDRQEKLEELLVEPARRQPRCRFLIAGAQYPQSFPWAQNIFFVRHLPPAQHPEFYSSARLVLNVTRQAMAEAGWCPSGRLFEAAACGAAIVSDPWPGLEEFFMPGREILIASNAADVIAALSLPDSDLRAIGANARRRVLADHTSDRRAESLARMIDRFTQGAAALDGAVAS